VAAVKEVQDRPRGRVDDDLIARQDHARFQDAAELPAVQPPHQDGSRDALHLGFLSLGCLQQIVANAQGARGNQNAKGYEGNGQYCPGEALGTVSHLEAHLETVKAARGGRPVCLDLGDKGRPGPGAQEREHLVEVRTGPLGDHLDAPIGPVPDVSAQPQFARAIQGVVAETDTLDAPVNDCMQTHVGWLSLTHICAL